MEALPELTLEHALLAVLGLGALGALRRVLTRSPGAWLAFLPLIGLAAAALWPERVETWFGATPAVDVEVVERAGPAEEARDGRGPQVAASSWRTWQGAVLGAPRGSRIALEGQERAWLDAPALATDAAGLLVADRRPPGPPPRWREAPVPAAFLWHPARVPADRAFDVWLRRPADAGEVTWVLTGAPADAGEGNEIEVARATVPDGAVELRFSVPAAPPAAGIYRLSAFPLDRPGERTVSRLEVLPRPRAVFVGDVLEELGAALEVQGYAVHHVPSPERDSDASLWVLGAGAYALAPAAEFAIAGGGVWIVDEGVWERWAESPLRSSLPAFPRAPLPPEGPVEGGEGPERNPEGQRTDPQLPENVDPNTARPQSVDVGSMGLLVLLDLSGSFHEQLATAWEHVSVALRESKGFDHVGVIGFAGKQAERLLALRKVDETLDAELRVARAELQRAMERALAEGTTLVAPGLELAASTFARETLSAKLVVVVSDGGFWDDRREWIQRTKELYLDWGVQVAAIFLRAQRVPTGGLQNLHQLARLGGTKEAREVRDLTRALQLVPVIAREVADAQRPPENPRREPDGAGSDAPPRPERGPEPRPERAFHLEPTGLHPAEGQGDELIARTWPALRHHRPATVRLGSGVAWRLRETGDPLLATAHLGAGRIGVLTAPLDEERWPGAAREPAFPLFCARMADYLRAAPPPAQEIRFRADGRFVRSPERAQPLAETELARTWLPAGPWVGTFVADPLRGVHSSLRPGSLAPGAAGETPFAGLVTAAAGAGPTTPPDEAPAGWRRSERIDALRLGSFVALGLLLEVLGAALRLRFATPRR